MGYESVTDTLINELIATPKRVINPQARRKADDGHERVDYRVASLSGDYEFRLYMRQNLMDAEDFSCGIRWLMTGGETLTLRRYNGANHIHGKARYQCHVHKATETAIQAGTKPEHQAELDNRYHTLDGALHCLLEDCHVTGLGSPPDEPDMFK